MDKSSENELIQTVAVCVCVCVRENVYKSEHL